MTPMEILTEMVARIAVPCATATERAERYRAAHAAVREAGRLAVPAWMLVRGLDVPDLIAEFSAQVAALRATAPTQAGDPPTVRPSSWRAKVGRIPEL